VGTLHKELH